MTPTQVRVKRLEAGESYVEDVSACELAAALESGQVPAVVGCRRVRRASTSP